MAEDPHIHSTFEKLEFQNSIWKVPEPSRTSRGIIEWYNESNEFRKPNQLTLKL